MPYVIMIGAAGAHQVGAQEAWPVEIVGRILRQEAGADHIAIAVADRTAVAAAVNGGDAGQTAARHHLNHA